MNDALGNVPDTLGLHLPSETSEHAQFFESDKRFERRKAIERLERSSVLDEFGLIHRKERKVAGGKFQARNRKFELLERLELLELLERAAPLVRTI